MSPQQNSKNTLSAPKILLAKFYQKRSSRLEGDRDQTRQKHSEAASLLYRLVYQIVGSAAPIRCQGLRQLLCTGGCHCHTIRALVTKQVHVYVQWRHLQWC